ncbi:MAG: nuclear transport factor 2 family protein [Novosphingobium sp.]|nr:nuclear transport factor 2 family protein [Novosphingobium sp.]MCP5379933.1 nuclear transport factor 2 family protein [Novosphingobium sp.]MCP5389054.1 nuclear transport factor 2 family protein [Novosphingobium sp.]
MSDIAAQLERLENIHALTRLINSYHQTADRFDWDGWAEHFTDDATFYFEHGFGEMTGREGIKEICKSSMDPFYDLMQHIMVNLDFEITGPATATGRANLIFTAVFDTEKRDNFYQAGGIYRWDFSKTDKGWLIANAYLDFVWNNGNDTDGVFE